MVVVVMKSLLDCLLDIEGGRAATGEPAPESRREEGRSEPFDRRPSTTGDRGSLEVSFIGDGGTAFRWSMMSGESFKSSAG